MYVPRYISEMVIRSSRFSKPHSLFRFLSSFTALPRPYSVATFHIAASFKKVQCGLSCEMFHASVALNMSTAAHCLGSFIQSGFRLCRLTCTTKNCGLNFGRGNSTWRFAIPRQPPWLRSQNKNHVSQNSGPIEQSFLENCGVRKMCVKLVFSCSRQSLC